MLSSATGTNIINVLISELYIVSVKCQVFGYRSVKSSSLRCSNCREVNKKRERRHVTYRQTRRLGVIGWTSADTLVWNVFGFWLFVYLPLPVVLLASAAASLLPLGRVLRLGVLNPLGIKCCSKEQGCCCSVWLFESCVNIFLYSWQKWLAARWGGWIKHLWVTLRNLQQKQNQIFAWSKLIFMRS